MLFLFGIYEGVKQGVTSYVRNSPADIWVCQKNSTNLLRSSSFIPSAFEFELSAVKGVDGSTGILRVLATANISGKSVTLFVFGFDPMSRLGAPSLLLKGNSSIGPGGIILDRAFAAKHHLTTGDSLQIQDLTFRVSGISEGSNAIVAQFAFTTLKDAQRLLGFPDIVSFFLLKAGEQQNVLTLVVSLRERFNLLSFFSKEEFIKNNLQEMETGVLPVLWTIALFGAMVGVSIITLLLYGSVLERREDYALLKAVGAGQRYLVVLVLQQSLLGTLAAFVFGLLMNIVCAPLLIKVIPEIFLHFTARATVAVFAASLFIGALGSWGAIHKLARIYPAEVFRA
jgi:putative ABC transport system permease protein